MLQAFMSGTLLGLFALPHCALMCGPLAAAACSRQAHAAPLRYQLGRTLGYGLAGLTAGQVGHVVRLALSPMASLVLFAASSAAACLFVAYTYLREPQPRAQLVALGTAPRARRYTSALVQLLPREPTLLGAMSALLPCGVLAAALLAAAATGSGGFGASLMLGFATVSGVALVAAGTLARFVVTASRGVKRGLAAVLVVVACVSVARPMRALLASPGSATAHAAMHCH